MNIKNLITLKSEISKFNSLVIAYSGGVDSSLLAKVATDILGKNAICVTIQTGYMSKFEIEEAIEFAKENSLNHQILKIDKVYDIDENPIERCYICKKQIFNTIKNSFKNSTIADGTNKDDLGEFRPGIRAAKELNVISPLDFMSKIEIRNLAKMLNLSTFNKPSRPCLLTRFPYNYKYDLEDIKLVQGVENLLTKYGYNDIRARFDGVNLKIEMPYLAMQKFINDGEFKNIIKNINSKFSGEITLDLKGLKKDVLIEKR